MSDIFSHIVLQIHHQLDPVVFFFYLEAGDKPLDYLFSCGDNGNLIVPLEAMCNRIADCANENDETHAFCPYRLKRGTICEPSCVSSLGTRPTTFCDVSYAAKVRIRHRAWWVWFRDYCVRGTCVDVVSRSPDR